MAACRRVVVPLTRPLNLLPISTQAHRNGWRAYDAEHESGCDERARCYDVILRDISSACQREAGEAKKSIEWVHSIIRQQLKELIRLLTSRRVCLSN